MNRQRIVDLAGEIILEAALARAAPGPRLVNLPCHPGIDVKIARGWVESTCPVCDHRWVLQENGAALALG